MSAKHYVGVRLNGRASVKVSTDGARARALAPRRDLMNHSPTGFEWGYEGSGPAQLALAICADALGDDARALRVYQQFKFRMIAPIDGDDFSMTGARVREVVAEIEKEKEHDDEAIRVRGAVPPEGDEGSGRAG
jgi:hypothetical protein